MKKQKQDGQTKYEYKDIENYIEELRQLSEQIMWGINGYLQAPLEKQRAFQRNLLNPYTPRNMLSRVMGRLRKSY